MGKKVNCTASINLLENGLLSEIAEESVKFFQDKLQFDFFFLIAAAEKNDSETLM